VSRAAIAAAAILACACGGGKELLPDGGSKHGPVTFRLSYNTTKGNTMYLQVADGQKWLTVSRSDGKALPIQEDCTKCFCDACGTCAACKPPASKVISVPQFGNTAFTWSGILFPAEGGKCASTDCQQRRSADEGRYTAKFCHSYSSVSDASGGQTIGEPICTDVGFDYPPLDGGTVVLDYCDC
jgi:hypothetical protein